VRSLAKNTLGSTRVGRAMRLPVWILIVSNWIRVGISYGSVLPGAVCRRGWVDIAADGREGLESMVRVLKLAGKVNACPMDV